MRILFLVDGEVHEPAARARVYDLAPALLKLGCDPRILSASDRAGPGGWSRLLHAARWADVVVLQRILPPRSVLALLERINPALVYDFDDALHTLPALRERLRTMLQAVVEVVAGSEQLAHHARGCAKSVTVVPTVVEPASYMPAADSTAGRPVRLGWIGTAGNLPFLEQVRPALGELGRRGRSFEVRVISSAFPHWPELPLAPVPWSVDRAPSALAALDIGLAPLPDTPWTRGKCGRKAVEYMASGLPVVAAPVGALSEIVVHGETGLLAAGQDEWVEHLDTLVIDAGLRRRFGFEGRRRVEERYSVAVAVPALVEVLQRAVTTVRRSAA
ncbi:MAG: glycosyltransferase [Actinomycetota bacterium]|nr:glycosyltransferase [Actinomycetota bacterium]